MKRRPKTAISLWTVPIIDLEQKHNGLPKILSFYKKKLYR